MNDIKKNISKEYWKGKIGLERAKSKILILKEKLGKIPTTRDIKKELGGGIYYSVKKGHWKAFNVESWTDFLIYCELEPAGKWTGKEGLKKAVHEILSKAEDLGRTPIKKDIPSGIPLAARRGQWGEYGINSWNDLLRYCKLEITHEVNMWVGKQGLDRAAK